jgi:hypothetical protein
MDRSKFKVREKGDQKADDDFRHNSIAKRVPSVRKFHRLR